MAVHEAQLITREKTLSSAGARAAAIGWAQSQADTAAAIAAQNTAKQSQ